MVKRNSVYILTGPVHSGKSTALKNWLDNKSESQGGFLHLGSPKALFMLNDKEYFPFEKDKTTTTNDVLVGKYIFSSIAFDKMNDELKVLKQRKPSIIVIDEIGKLELKGAGIDHGLRHFISTIPTFSSSTIILVARDYLLEEVIEKYALENAKVILKEELDKI
jgi:nucleoside-triphosphatase THEP1